MPRLVRFANQLGNQPVLAKNVGVLGRLQVDKAQRLIQTAESQMHLLGRKLGLATGRFEKRVDIRGLLNFKRQSGSGPMGDPRRNVKPLFEPLRKDR